LLNTAYSQEASERCRTLQDHRRNSDESSLRDLIARIEGKTRSPGCTSSTCWPFQSSAGAAGHPAAAQGQQQFIRAAALSRCPEWTDPRHAAICSMLKDPEIEVQNKA